MTLLLPEPPPVSAGTYTREQLHQRACITCGEPGRLVPVGHVAVNNGDGGELVWAVAAHPEHLRVRAC